MLGLLVRLTPRQIPSIAETKRIKIDTNLIRSLRTLAAGEIRNIPNREIKNPGLRGIAVIGVNQTRGGNLVLLTARVESSTTDQKALNLQFIKRFKDSQRWFLPSGYGESREFTIQGYELVESEKEVLSCLVRSPADLVKAGPINLPLSFRWSPAAAANLIIEFDTEGKPVLIRRRAFERRTIGDLETYSEALNQVWVGMSGQEFESAMEELFTCLGFKVKITPATRDGGVDLVVERVDHVLGSDKYVVQCKKYDPRQRIVSSVVRQLRGTAQAQKAQRGILVTTASFTSDAAVEAKQDGVPVELVDGRALGKLTLSRLHELPSIRGRLDRNQSSMGKKWTSTGEPGTLDIALNFNER